MYASTGVAKFRDNRTLTKSLSFYGTLCQMIKKTQKIHEKCFISLTSRNFHNLTHIISKSCTNEGK